MSALISFISQGHRSKSNMPIFIQVVELDLLPHKIASYSTSFPVVGNYLLSQNTQIAVKVKGKGQMSPKSTQFYRDQHDVHTNFKFAIAYVIARPSVCLSSVVRLQRSCTLLRRLKFSARILRHLVRWLSIDVQVKFYGDRSRGTSPSGELNTRGVAKYSDVGPPIERYISETV